MGVTPTQTSTPEGQPPPRDQQYEHRERRKSMWKSVIRDYPEEYDDRGNINPLFVEWAEALTAEPWLLALQDIVRWRGIWTGTEEGLTEELRFRVNREVREAEDFPSDFPKLRHYFGVAWEVSHYCSSGGLGLELFRYDELSREDLKEFDVPGWGPEAPILVERGFAGRRPSYYAVMFELAKYEDPLLLAFLIFTDSPKFARNRRRWTGSTVELAELLRAYYPRPSFNCPMYLAHLGWSSEGGPDAFMDHAWREPLDELWWWKSSDYRRFHGRMRTCARILKEVGIKVSREKASRTVRGSQGGRKRTKRTRWAIEAPRWES